MPSKDVPLKISASMDFPFAKYRGAVLLRQRLRKPRKCHVCGGSIKAREMAWAVLVENIRRNVNRSMRWHLSHFEAGKEYEP